MTDEQQIIYKTLSEYEENAYMLEMKAIRQKAFVAIGKSLLINDSIDYEAFNRACVNLNHTSYTPRECWTEAMKPNWKD